MKEWDGTPGTWRSFSWWTARKLEARSLLRLAAAVGFCIIDGLLLAEIVSEITPENAAFLVPAAAVPGAGLAALAYYIGYKGLQDRASAWHFREQYGGNDGWGLKRLHL